MAGFDRPGKIDFRIKFSSHSGRDEACSLHCHGVKTTMFPKKHTNTFLADASIHHKKDFLLSLSLNVR